MTADGRNHYQDWDLFALGALEESELREMTAHLESGCESCVREYLAAQAVVAGLSTLSPDQGLPEGAELRMRDRLRAHPSSPKTIPVPVFRTRGWKMGKVAPWALAAVCLIAATLLGVRLLHVDRELGHLKFKTTVGQSRPPLQVPGAPNSGGGAVSEQLGDLQKTIDSLRLELKAAQTAKLQADQQLAAARARVQQSEARIRELDASLKDADEKRSRAEEALAGARLQLAKAQVETNRIEQVTAQNQQIISLIQSPKLSQLDLKPTGSVQASARVFWQDDHGLLFVARDLPPLNQTASYQLWFYRQGTPSVVNVGVIQLGKSGSGLLFVQPGPALLSMTGALVTEEPQSVSASVPGQEILKVKP